MELLLNNAFISDTNLIITFRTHPYTYMVTIVLVKASKAYFLVSAISKIIALKVYYYTPLPRSLSNF